MSKKIPDHVAEVGKLIHVDNLMYDEQLSRMRKVPTYRNAAGSKLVVDHGNRIEGYEHSRMILQVIVAEDLKAKHAEAWPIIVERAEVISTLLNELSKAGDAVSMMTQKRDLNAYLTRFDEHLAEANRLHAKLHELHARIEAIDHRFAIDESVTSD